MIGYMVVSSDKLGDDYKIFSDRIEAEQYAEHEAQLSCATYRIEREELDSFRGRYFSVQSPCGSFFIRIVEVGLPQ